MSGLLFASQQAYAQNTTNNAITQSKDAFGRSVGNERVGIYSNDEVRGFKTDGRFDANVGARFRFDMGKTKVLLRGLVQNVFNAFNWKVSNSGVFTFNLPQTASVQLNADF